MAANSEGMFVLLSAVFVVLAPRTTGLDNGLAATPPMGWMAWERFRCNVDCKNDPDNCISETLIKQMADAMAFSGYKQVGYEYICIDDCWMAKNRTDKGELQADPERFPNQIKHLAEYVHSRGLKFGIYADYGTKTCAGYPGSIHHIQQDAKTFADWKVDYLKLDGCYASPAVMDEGYPKFSQALNATGRPIMFSCSWPAYQVFSNMTPKYELIGKYCNLWRNYGDIQDSWDSVVNIVDWYGNNQKELIKASGPGHWNDPDMLIIGDFSLSYEQARSQFALWAILAAPLMMSNDLRNIDYKFKEILLNSEVIAVNQDRLGRHGKRVFKSHTGMEVWCRALSDGAVAVALFSKRVDEPAMVQASFDLVGIRSKNATARDLFAHKELGTYEKTFQAKVNPSGVVMVKLTPCSCPCNEDHKRPRTKKEKHGRKHAIHKHAIRSQLEAKFLEYLE